MRDKSRYDLDVDDALAEWHAQTSDLAALRRELAEEREVIGIIARERDQLRGRLHEISAELTKSIAREREADRAVQKLLDIMNEYPKGALAAFRDWLTRGTA